MARIGGLLLRSRRLVSTESSIGLDLYDHTQKQLLEFGPEIFQHLNRNGVGFFVIDNLLGNEFLTQMRHEAETMYKNDKFMQSESEIMDENGILQRFDKEGVFALEMDGSEVDIAPALVHYTAAVLHTLPQVINHYFLHENIQISSSTYGSKLAVALGNGSKYPKHVDNVGLPDLRKLTCVFYLNPNWNLKNGGDIRVFGNDDVIEDISPIGDRLVMFWSDQVVHEVLENNGLIENENSRRYALTLWLVSETPESIAEPNHPLSKVRLDHFPQK